MLKRKPMDKNLAKDLTLRWVNKIRAYEGMHKLDELPKGNKGCPSTCIVANATGNKYKVTGPWIMRDQKKVYRTPLHVKWFITHFDTGKYPELVKRMEDVMFEKKVGALLEETKVVEGQTFQDNELRSQSDNDKSPRELRTA